MVVDPTVIAIKAVEAGIAELDSEQPSVFGGVLPKSCDVATGDTFIVISAGGGDVHAEIADWATDRILVRTWADTPARARALYAQVLSWLHAKQNVLFAGVGHLKSCLCVVAGQDVIDAETGWASTIAFFNVISRPETD